MDERNLSAAPGLNVDRLERMLAGRLPLPESIDAHVRERQLSLAASLAQKMPIYLDSRFWIDLRRAADNPRDPSRAFPLLMALKDAVNAGKAFCPISTSTFIEMLKHGDKEIRLASAKLVDELSLGITLVPLDQLLRAEVRWFVDNPGDVPLDPRAEPIWTRLAYSLGTPVPKLPGVPARELLAFQTAAFDEIWQTTLEECATTLSDPMRPDFKAAAEKITKDSSAHSHEIATFEDAYKSELAPMAEMGSEFFAERIREKAKEAGQPTRMGRIEVGLCRNILRNTLALGKARQALRSAHIRASLHAIIRHNKGRRFKPNDIFDIEHAVCGLGYCRAFFTEGSLGTATRQPPLRLDRLYRCLVTNDIEEATRFVSEIM